MIVKWANDGLLQANEGEMLLNDGEMNDHTLNSPSLTIISPSFAHLTIIEKLQRLQGKGGTW